MLTWQVGVVIVTGEADTPKLVKSQQSLLTHYTTTMHGQLPLQHSASSKWMDGQRYVAGKGGKEATHSQRWPGDIRLVVVGSHI